MLICLNSVDAVDAVFRQVKDEPFIWSCRRRDQINGTVNPSALASFLWLASKSKLPRPQMECVAT